MTTTRRTISVALVMSALIVLPAAPAMASAPDQSCWYDVDTDAMGCFDASLDPHEQIELETGATLIAVPTGDHGRLQSVVAEADPVYLLATGWDATAQTGASISYYTSNAKICAGLSHSFSNLQAWNNRFESLQSYNGCEAYLYDGTGYSGSEYGPVASSSTLGTFNNRAESMIVE
ncbi:hypothetical protein [Microbacterium sp. P04]|uniref:hypothetical protein n=1 Tax=Microbacterium sp. P04 TaxID=3366947 RepID=UPI003745CA1E